MKYKLINKQTGETHLCEKVIIDGFDYYVSDENINVGDYYLTFTNKTVMGNVRKCEDSSYNFTHCKKVIATNNPNIDVPKVVDEVEELSNSWYYKSGKITPSKIEKSSFIAGYNKSQETHPFTEEDMIEFAKKCCHFQSGTMSKDVSNQQLDELLQLWKEQKAKTLYYE